MKISALLRILGSLLTLAVSINASAYLSVFDNGNILAKDTHRVLLGGQGLFSEYKGANVQGRFATHLNDAAELQFEMGGGSVDFNGGGYLKFVPYPDTEDQPAIGLRAGYNYARIGDNARSSIVAQPFMSKNFQTERGRFVPYAAIPLSVTHFKDETFVPVHVVVGSEWQPTNLKKVRFFGEYGMNAIHAYNYVSLSMAVDFDGEGLFFE